MGALTHAYVTARPDSGDPGEVSADAWNAAHDLSALVLSDYPGLVESLRASVACPPIINGAFNVNQLQKTGTVTLAAGAYGHDGWMAGAGGCSYTFAKVGGKTTVTIASGTLLQVAEGKKLRSGSYAVAWSGTATGRIGTSGAFAASPLAATCTAGTKVVVEFGTGTLTDVRMNAGTVALPFYDRGDDAELTLCKRYCFKLDTSAAISTSFIAPVCIAPFGGAFLEGFFDEEMADVPSVVFEGSIGNYAIYDVAAGVYRYLVSAPTVNAVTGRRFYLINLSLASSGTAGTGGYLAQTTTPSESVRFEARLQP